MKFRIISFVILTSFLTVNSIIAQKTKNDFRSYDLEFVSKFGDTGNGLLANPDRVFVDSKKNICITDYGDIKLKIYDSNGKLIKTIGQKGNGPGDFRWMHFAQNDNKNNLIIFDFLNKRLSVYDKNYFFVKTININDPVDNLISLPNGNYAAITRGDHSIKTQLFKYYLKFYDNNFKHICTPDSLEIYSFYQDNEGGFAYRYFDTFNLIKTNNGNILLSTSKDYKLRMFSGSGKKLFEKKINYNPVRIQEKDKDYFLNGKDNRAKKALSSIYNKPGIAAMITDNTGKIFIMTYEESNNKAIFDVFDSKGDFLYKAGFPLNFPYSKCAISDNYIYFIMLGDKTTPPSIAKYKIVAK